ncbi:GroES-like protein [Cylindrobasidium torrendii FP15055 ss-10]|uniref:GroES-like protein n=1 Tax=Cylindrobasidium torrendii FP15055 ss-10 TaxID=1314674 RepID=A0A0D7ATH0_9AGAR|nr:GroES-like protein [Cylindrobasidium torrendii FP15055 ss-10]
MVYSGITFTGSPSGEITNSIFTRDSLDAHEVLVKITHSGLCGTDLHVVNSERALGHEGIGIVSDVGVSVSRVCVGDRIGWGFIHSTCGRCKFCITGRDQYCTDMRDYFNSNQDQGSLGEIAILKEDWLFKIPEGLSSEHAAPLMCAGATVFTPLLEHCKPTDRVGIVGVGGLGHLAIQLASRMGCDVVVFSGSCSKRKEAMAMGASEFHATAGTNDFSQLNMSAPVDRLIVTTASLPDWEQYFKVLAANATIIPITAAFGLKMEFPFMQFLMKGYHVVGSIIAGRAVHEAMLEFCARNKVFPIIEKFPLTQEGVADAVRKLQEGKMRYRGVLLHDAQ